MKLTSFKNIHKIAVPAIIAGIAEPILSSTDAAIVGRLAGAVMMVGAFGKTDLKEVEVARARLEQSNIEVKGFILNMIEKRASSGYGYGYGYYNYEYKSKDKA